MKALITGKSGFVGKHLTDHLIEEGFDVYSYDLSDGDDLRDFEVLRNKLDKIRPAYIFHLAAQAFVPESFHNPQRAFEVNTIGSLNLLEAVRQLGIKTRILMAGTSEEYGGSDNGEVSLPDPSSPYAISKLAMTHTAMLYAKSYGINVVVTRAFNHTGPGRGEMYAESSFAKQIVEIERGKRTHLEHGNLKSVRNYTDVRDIVRAYRLAIDLPSDVYNVCSDQNVTMQQVLDSLIRQSTVEIETKVNENLYRLSDFSFKKPNCDKFKSLIKWQPKINLETTMSDILKYWREK